MIEVHNLTFGYSSAEDGQILKGVDFAAKTGKLTALIGTNGARARFPLMVNLYLNILQRILVVQ